MIRKLLLIATLFVVAFLSVQAQDSIKYSHKQVADDIRFFMSNAAEIHPNLYHDISRQALTDKTDSLIKILPDTLTPVMAYRAFLQTTAFINEGHTSMNTPQVVRAQLKSGRVKYIPIQVNDYRDAHFEATGIATASNLGDVKISAINGQSAKDIFNQMMQLKGGLASFKKVIAVKSFPLFLAAIGVHGPYTVEYTGKGRGKKVALLNGISQAEYIAAMKGAINPEPYTFTVLNKKYGYLNFRSMRNGAQFEKFADSVFKTIDEQKINKLVIDLRENSGGDSGLGDYLLGYVTETPYRMAGGSQLKVSQQFKTFMKTPGLNYSKPDAYFTMANGTSMNFGGNDLRKPDDRKYKFKGKVCFLIGSFTFSSANMLASTVKDYKLATLVGEPVGEPANDYGELCTINLPNTGFSGFTSTTLWIRPNGNTRDSKPVAPDYLVKANSGAGDKVLEYALEWLDGRK